jgi:deazaflavin-dependent oxidoreductase (nitroreductase family)
MDLIDEAIIADTLPAIAKDHARRYLASNGRDGHLTVGGGAVPAMQNVTSLLLVTRGRKTGKPYLMPLFYGADAGRYVVIASKGGAPDNPGWFKNLAADPSVRIQVGERRMAAHASVASGAERERLWRMMAKAYPPYDDYAVKAAPREIPLIVLTPKP